MRNPSQCTLESLNIGTYQHFYEFSICVLSRNDLTNHLNNDVSRLSNRDILRIILLYRVKGTPVVEIARDFRVTRQRVYQLLTQFKKSGKYPTNRRTGRKPQPINERTEQLILESYRAKNVGPTYLEKKIEETYGIHIPHNRIYRVLLDHDLVEINMRKRQQRKYVRYERAHSMWQGGIGKNSSLMVRRDGLSHSWMIHRVS